MMISSVPSNWKYISGDERGVPLRRPLVTSTRMPWPSISPK